MPKLIGTVGRLLGVSHEDRSSKRRQASRRTIEAPVRLTISGCHMQARTGNISLGGVFIDLSEPPPVGTLVELEIDLGGDPVRAKAEVVWIRRIGSALGAAGVGCEFRRFETGRSELRRFLRSDEPIDRSS
ncbi:MAG: PilZ domain-containing protein [Thermoanaerobaculia bacterium]